MVGIRGLACISFLVWNLTTAAELSSPVKQSSFHLPPGSEVPHWSNGYITSRSTDLLAWTTIDRTGATSVCSLAGAFPEASNIQIVNPVAVSGRGELALPVTADAPPSRSGQIHVGMIVFVNPPCHVSRVVRMDANVAATHLAFDPDGSLWALVRAVRVAEGIVQEAPVYDMIRHYDASGKLIGTALPRSNLKYPYPVNNALLQVSSDHIGFFIDGPGRWVEMSKTDQIVRNWAVGSRTFSHTPDAVQTIVLTQEDEVFVKQTDNLIKGHTDDKLLHLDKETGALDQVDTSAVGGGQVFVPLGYDNGHLVLQGRSESLYWVDFTP